MLSIPEGNRKQRTRSDPKPTRNSGFRGTQTHPNGDVQIMGYPESSFRPTDFHSATAIHGDQAILLIGNVGYADERSVGKTQIYWLDTTILTFKEIASSAYVDDMEHLTVTVEGELPASVIESIAGDVQRKLSLVENIECCVRWLE